MRFEDMLEAIDRIERYMAGLTYEMLLEDERTADAVTRNVGVIGEAAARVPAEIQERYPDLPWAAIRGMRNVVIHEYPSVDLEIVWRTVVEDLPGLKLRVEEILAREG